MTSRRGILYVLQIRLFPFAVGLSLTHRSLGYALRFGLVVGVRIAFAEGYAGPLCFASCSKLVTAGRFVCDKESSQP